VSAPTEVRRPASPLGRLVHRATEPARENPWVTPALTPHLVEPSAAHTAPLSRRTGPAHPQPNAVHHAGTGLPVCDLPEGEASPSWWWLGVHGGAGATTLAQAVGKGRDAHRHWPAPADPETGLERVVLVARAHHHGLHMAQVAARQWASGALPGGIVVLGLVLVADTPGKAPKPLREMAQLVCGGYPRTWEIGWHEGSRLGSALDPTALPSDFRELSLELSLLSVPNQGGVIHG
jgi:hypothetical protein